MTLSLTSIVLQKNECIFSSFFSSSCYTIPKFLPVFWSKGKLFLIPFTDGWFLKFRYEKLLQRMIIKENPKINNSLTNVNKKSGSKIGDKWDQSCHFSIFLNIKRINLNWKLYGWTTYNNSKSHATRPEGTANKKNPYFQTCFIQQSSIWASCFWYICLVGLYNLMWKNVHPTILSFGILALEVVGTL